MNTYQSKLKLENICFSYGNEKVLENISLDIKEGQITGIIGPSGCGKTTLFNIISGLLKAESGKIYFDKNVKIAYMLQKDLLLPYMTVFDNISLPFILNSEHTDKMKKKVYEMADIFGIKELLSKYPNKLSGGQRQRVALLRTYMFSSELILLDEPFSSLDYITKEKLYDWFIDLREKINMTSLLVSHDIEEIIRLCDVIYVLNGKPSKIVKRIDNSFKNLENLKKEIKEYLK